MIFRQAKSSEAETVLALYRSVVGRPHCVWDEIYPSMANVREDLASGCLYVLESEGELIGALSIVPENEQDDLLFWRSKTAREIARVVIRPDHQGKHLAFEMVKGIEPVLRAMGCPAVHLLAAKQNPAAFRTYLRAGYEVRGECRRYGHIYMACERML